MMLEGGVVGVLDCGMAGYIDEELRQEFEDLLLAAVQKDGRELTDIIVRLGSVPPELERRTLQSEIGEFLADYAGQSLESFDLSGALNGMTDIIRRYRIILPSSCFHAAQGPCDVGGHVASTRSDVQSCGNCCHRTTRRPSSDGSRRRR